MKAVLRGEIISSSSYDNKARRVRMEDISKLILELDTAISEKSSPDLLKSRTDLQAEFNLLSTEKAEAHILRMQGLTYEFGEWGSRLLAHQLWRLTASRLISHIKDSSNNIVTHPKEINKIFVKYYTALYSSEGHHNPDIMHSFLNKLKLPKLDPDTVQNLEEPITLEEILNAIGSMSSGKTPGPGGFGVEFYKKFKEKLSPLLLEVFEESLENSYLPPTFTQATISLIPKKDKDPTLCGSYPSACFVTNTRFLRKYWLIG